MPVTVGERKRIKRLHEEGNHDRCDIRVCAKAAKESEALAGHDAEQYRRLCGLRAKAIMDECAAQQLDPADYLDDVAAALEDIAALDGETPDRVSVLAARAEIKMMPH